MGWRTFHKSLKPDAISWAKGMGGGIPIGGFWVSDREIQDADVALSSILGPSSHGSTYGGNPLSCAVSHAVLSEIIEENLCQNVSERSEQVMKEINSWNHPLVSEIRGAGLLLGVSLVTDEVKLKEGETASIKLCNILSEKGLLVPPAGTDTIRLLPPLNVSAENVSEALSILKSGLDEL